MGFLTAATTGEQDTLATFTMQQYTQLRTALHGITDEQLRATPTAGALSLGWLALHTANVATTWGEQIAGRELDPDLLHDETPAADTTVDDVLAVFDEKVTALERILRGRIDLSAPIPVPDEPWFPQDVEAWETRWAIAHIATEVARHAGHADLVRETLDGKTSYELNDLADGKEPVDWSTFDEG